MQGLKGAHLLLKNIFFTLLVPAIKIQRLNFKFFNLLLQSAESGKKKVVGIHQAFLLLFFLSLSPGVWGGRNRKPRGEPKEKREKSTFFT